MFTEVRKEEREIPVARRKSKDPPKSDKRKAR